MMPRSAEQQVGAARRSLRDLSGCPIIVADLAVKGTSLSSAALCRPIPRQGSAYSALRYCTSSLGSSFVRRERKRAAPDASRRAKAELWASRKPQDSRGPPANAEQTPKKRRQLPLKHAKAKRCRARPTPRSTSSSKKRPERCRSPMSSDERSRRGARGEAEDYYVYCTPTTPWWPSTARV